MHRQSGARAGGLSRIVPTKGRMEKTDGGCQQATTHYRGLCCIPYWFDPTSHDASPSFNCEYFNSTSHLPLSAYTFEVIAMGDLQLFL